MKDIKYYLVDSENVNDNWLMLFELADETDRIIVFYTQKSPHMSYPSVVKLMNSSLSIKFEECFEGTNALDFQLVSYLGYLMKNDETVENEYIIMTNDNGFDAAVNFWKKRGFPVSKINVNYCKIKIHQKTKALPAPADEKKSEDKEDIISEKAIAEKAENSPENADGNADSAVQADKVPETAIDNEESADTDEGKNADNSESDEKITELSAVAADAEAAPEEGDIDSIKENQSLTENKTEDFDKKEVDTVINCLNDITVTWLYQALRHIYGNEQGSRIYNAVKNGSYAYTKKKYARKNKIKYMVKIIFKHGEMTAPKDFAEFLEKNKELQTPGRLKTALAGAYGKKAGDEYYKLFKPHFKMISAIK